MAGKRRPSPSAKCPVCSPKPALEERPLIDDLQAAALRGLFKILANDTRVRLLHALARARELCVTDLAEAIKMKPQAVSNQLQRLVDQGILSCRRNGNNVHYRIADPCVTMLLEHGICLVEDARGRRP
ncbi:MAG TPA: metalloregulator ArsR/SmtB family transcription factor [Candidatus Tectomicrobia bacterium]|nr:metalloregulator ArsR/SmtB family transcription factor [Candidatus Tectomicrobia bacterium]